MSQRIAVRGIVQLDGKILILQRSIGRPSILGKYELPGGKIEYGEQPEAALSRHIESDTGLVVQTTTLSDAFTYIDYDDRDVQYILILYKVGLNGGGERTILSQNYSRYQWKSLTDIHQDELTESTKLLLGLSQQYVTSAAKDQLIIKDVEKTADVDHLIVYSDGGSRGNPGPSAAGFVIMDEREHVIHEGGMYLGITTNNLAEYQGVRLGLEKALEMGARTVEFRTDSLLVVNQMRGMYKIKNRELWPIHERVREIIGSFEKVSFTHVKREYNQLADGMVNKILNAHVPE